MKHDLVLIPNRKKMTGQCSSAAIFIQKSSYLNFIGFFIEKSRQNLLTCFTHLGTFKNEVALCKNKKLIYENLSTDQ